MWTPSEFDQALSVVSEKYKTLERQMSWLKPYDRDQAYALYRNANDSVFGFLVVGGPVSILKETALKVVQLRKSICTTSVPPITAPKSRT